MTSSSLSPFAALLAERENERELMMLKLRVMAQSSTPAVSTKEETTMKLNRSAFDIAFLKTNGETALEDRAIRFVMGEEYYCWTFCVSLVWILLFMFYFLFVNVNVDANRGKTMLLVFCSALVYFAVGYLVFPVWCARYRLPVLVKILDAEFGVHEKKIEAMNQLKEEHEAIRRLGMMA